MQRRFLLALGTAILVACGGGDSADPSVVRADSAGVRLITSTGPDKPLGWKFDTVGVLRDSVGEPWLFTNVSTSDVLTDRAGRVYVLEREPAVRRFGRDGTYERSFGRRGGAPGEMQLPFLMRQQGDSIAVLDLARQAIVRWDPEFEPISDIRLDGAFADVRDFSFRPGGVWLLRQYQADSATVNSFHLDSGSTSPSFKISRPTPRMVQVSCSGGLNFSAPFPPFFSPAIQFDASGGRVLVNVGPGYDLQLIEGMRHIARIRRDLVPRAPTVDDVRAQFPDGMKIQFGGSAACTLDLEALIASAGIAEWLPFVTGVALLSDGTMWVKRSGNAKPVVLDVFDSDGSYAGTLTGHSLPVGRLPTGEVLFPVDDEDSGGVVIARVQISK